MATKNAESSIQGLNIIPTDSLSDELSPMSDDINRDLEAQLAMWTNFQFPTSSSYPSREKQPVNNNVDEEGGEEDVRIFSPERDTASRSRHKTAVPIEDFPSSAFFGNVGASLLAAHHHPASERGGHAAAHERAKLQQLQQHLQQNQGTSGGAGNTEHNHHAINHLFSYLPYDTNDLGPTIVDPFLNPSEYAAGVGVGGGLPPLTIRSTRDASIRQQIQMQMQQMQQMQTIDPSTTTLSHPHPHTLPRPIIPLPSTGGGAKRGPAAAGRTKSAVRPNIIIPVDRALDYALHPPSGVASSTIGDDDEGEEHDEDHDHDHEMHDPTSPNLTSPNANLTPQQQQLDASGRPIPYSAAEDKRRRNTLASARFRQKKKEREAAMERKARDLDERVAKLERECESLRKENRMLRGLLVDGVPAGGGASLPSADVGGGGVHVEEGKNAPAAAAAALGAGSAGGGTGASVVLLEELVRLLRANSAVLQPTSNGGVSATSAAGAGASGAARSTTGKRKRSGGGAN